MSKAFTRESDDSAEEPLASLRPALPAGARNYLTKESADSFRRELDRLGNVERPATLARPDSAERAAQLRQLDARLGRLRRILESAVVVDPAEGDKERVRFGAAVTVQHASGERSTFRIVGVDETDLEKNFISWLSPIAKALVGRRAGERVKFRFPTGEDELLILAID